MHPFGQVVLLAFSAFWLTEALRVAPGLDRWRDRKPLACSLCMSLWTVLACAGLAFLLAWPVDPRLWPAAAGGAYALLRWREKPPLRLP